MTPSEVIDFVTLIESDATQTVRRVKQGCFVAALESLQTMKDRIQELLHAEESKD